MADAKSNAFESALLRLLFQNSAIPNIGDAGGLQPSAVAGSLYVSLHVASPGEGGGQDTNETLYSGYAGRVGVVRSTGAWGVSGPQAFNQATITFGTSHTFPSADITHVGVGTAASGAGKLLWYGALATPLPMGVGITPEFPPGTLVIEEL